MALPGSGTITILQISDEFGGAIPDRMNEYYRGGAYVPDTANNSGIPTSGTIQLDDFYGTAQVTYDYEDAEPCQNEADWTANSGAYATTQQSTGVECKYSGSGGWFGIVFKSPLAYTIADNTKTYYIRTKTTKTNMAGVEISVGSSSYSGIDVLDFTTLTDAATESHLLDVSGHTKIYVKIRSTSNSESINDKFILNDFAIYYT